MPTRLNTNFDDKERLNDALAAQRYLAERYNSYASDCVNQKLKDELISILAEEHQIESEVFTEIQNRGWRQTTPADQQRIRRTRERFTGDSSND